MRERLSSGVVWSCVTGPVPDDHTSEDWVAVLELVLPLDSVSGFHVRGEEQAPDNTSQGLVVRGRGWEVTTGDVSLAGN